MSDIQFLDALGQKPVKSIRFGELSKSEQIVKSCLIRNTGSAQLENVRVKVVEAGESGSDYSHLKDRAIMQLRYTRQSTGKEETIYVALTPIRITSELEDIDLKTALIDGVLQLSADTFRWGNYAEVGPLAQNEDVQIFLRLLRMDASKSSQNFSFSIRNVGTDNLQNAVLDACCGEKGSDKLSLDSVAWTEHLSLGNMDPGQGRTVKIITYQLSADPAQAELIVDSVPELGPEQPYPTPTVVGSIRLDITGSGRYYATLSTIREFLTTINVDVVSTDEEILDLILKATERIEEETRRRFCITAVTERYDDPGIGKLVLRNWPIIEITAIRLYDQSNRLVKELKLTDPDWSERVIIDKKYGFLELPITRQPIFLATDIMQWRTGAPAERVAWPRSADVRRMTSIVTWIEVDYSSGYQVIPQLVRDTCTKLVVMVLLGKKGASESQGTSTITIAGLGETWGQGAGVYGGPFGSLIGQLNAEVERGITLLRRRGALAVSIL